MKHQSSVCGNSILARQGLAEMRHLVMKDKCVMEHSAYNKVNGWIYCPWCGVKIVIVAHCDVCGKDFFSQAAYDIHKSGEVAKYPKCPKQTGNTHRVVFHKRRNVFFCTECRIEIKPKEAKA